MNDSRKNQNQAPQVSDPAACAEFQKHLPELLEDENPNLSADPHIIGCANCAALVRDLEAIAQAARELLPTYEPSPDLWNQIQSAMKSDLPENPPLPPAVDAAGKK